LTTENAENAENADDILPSKAPIAGAFSKVLTQPGDRGRSRGSCSPKKRFSAFSAFSAVMALFSAFSVVTSPSRYERVLIVQV